MPEILIGLPDSVERAGCRLQEVDSIALYFPANLKVKEGFSHIHIRLRKFLFWDWLEIEGAQGIAKIST